LLNSHHDSSNSNYYYNITTTTSTTTTTTTAAFGFWLTSLFSTDHSRLGRVIHRSCEEEHFGIADVRFFLHTKMPFLPFNQQCQNTGRNNNNEKSAQRDANTVRWCSKVRTPPAHCHKPTDRTDYNILHH